MGMYVHGIAASENIDSSGERISIAGMDISSLAVDGVFNYEHKSDLPEQIVGKVLKAKKIFSEQDCEDDAQLAFLKKTGGVPYLYVMGELFDDYKESAKEVAGMFRYDADHKETNDKNVMNFSIEGAKIDKQGMDILKSIARKVTLTALPCNKAAIAEMVSLAPKKPKRDSIDELFKTEEVKAEIFSGPLVKNQPALTVTPPPASIGSTKSGKAISASGRVGDYKDFSESDHRDASAAHLGMATKLGETNFKQAQFHRNKGLLHNSAANTMADRAKRMTAGKISAPVPGKPAAPKIATSVVRPYGQVADIKKTLDAGSGMAAPSQLVGGAALAKEDMAKGKVQKSAGFYRVKAKKPKSAALLRAEQEYKTWPLKAQFEDFMAKRMPNLAKGEIAAIGQVMALNKSINIEQALASLAGIKPRIMSADPLNKNAGKDSIFTLILFEGCELHDILHCSHFATDDVSKYEEIKKVMDEYFHDGVHPDAHELSFKDAGTLGKHAQPVLFLTEGDPYRDLLEKLKEVAKYKYAEFKPHISVTSNVDEFKGRASCIVISVNGEIKKTYRF